MEYIATHHSFANLYLILLLSIALFIHVGVRVWWSSVQEGRGWIRCGQNSGEEVHSLAREETIYRLVSVTEVRLERDT
jgi:hypothetical protein